MSQPSINCIVPVFNGERYLGEALDSIFQQTYRHLEVIVVDDGSTDGTAAVVKRYGDRIRYIKQKNGGASTARNVGLSVARGDFVAFLDADDLWHPEKLQRQLARFEARPDLDVCVTHLQNFWIPELKTERERLVDHQLTKILPGYVTVTLLARRAVFERVGAFNAELKVGDDTEWFLRACEAGVEIELLPHLLVFRRIHQNNLSMDPFTRRRSSAMESAALQIVKASLDRRRKGSETVTALTQLPPSSWRKTPRNGR